MGMGRGDALAREFMKSAPVEEDIHRVPRKMPALDEHIPRAHLVDLNRGRAHIFQTLDL